MKITVVSEHGKEAVVAILGENEFFGEGWANFGKEGKPEPIIARITQQTLAEMIGTTRSRVSFFMNKFRKQGFIHYNGHIEVHSSLLNVVLTSRKSNLKYARFADVRPCGYCPQAALCEIGGM